MYTRSFSLLSKICVNLRASVEKYHPNRLIRLDDFDASLSEGFEAGLRGVPVGDDGVNFVQFAEERDGFASEFGVVETEDHFLGCSDHFFLNVD